MSEEIKELDMDKYLVLKQEDLNSLFDEPNTEYLENALGEIKNCLQYMRNDKGKPQNQYLVLNIEDEIDLQLFFKKTEERFNKTIYWWPRQKIKDIAVDIINAIR